MIVYLFGVLVRSPIHCRSRARVTCVNESAHAQRDDSEQVYRIGERK